MDNLRLKKAVNSKVTLRKMTKDDIILFNEIQKKKKIEIYKATIFGMIGLMTLVVVMILLYNLNL